MEGWMKLFEEIAACGKCPLCAGRTYAVPGEGNPKATLMLIGEGPGQEEDISGRPFVGASGALLTALLHSVEIERTEVYIANIVKCRPPGNRAPTPDEAANCMEYLRRQLALVQPKLVVLLGATAARAILEDETRIRRDHGRWTEKKGILFMPTFHPSALLRDPSQKILAYKDFASVREKLKELEGCP